MGSKGSSLTTSRDIGLQSLQVDGQHSGIAHSHGFFVEVKASELI